MLKKHTPPGFSRVLLSRHRCLLLDAAVSSFAQDIQFDFNGTGEVKSITRWGPILHGPAGQYAAIDFPHGENQVDVVRINFFMEEPLDADG